MLRENNINSHNYRIIYFSSLDCFNLLKIPFSLLYLHLFFFELFFVICFRKYNINAQVFVVSLHLTLSSNWHKVYKYYSHLSDLVQCYTALATLIPREYWFNLWFDTISLFPSDITSENYVTHLKTYLNLFSLLSSARRLNRNNRLCSSSDGEFSMIFVFVSIPHIYHRTRPHVFL